jgi:hypothetical protein
MKYKDLELCFKGDRDYLHGTTLFDSVMEWIIDTYQDKTITKLDASFHHLVHRQVALYDTPVEEDESVGIFSFFVDGERKKIFLHETDTPVRVRIACSEEQIREEIVIDFSKQQATLHQLQGFSDMELWVFMIKELHYNIYPDLEGKWLFVRAQFPAYGQQIHPVQKLVVRVLSNFQNKLTRSGLFVNDDKVGEIYFSLI